MAETFGKYRIIRKIAQGGMAEVFLARQEGDVGGFSREVAVKRMFAHLVDRENVITMFIDEARIVSHVQHPNIVQIYDLGVVDRTFYLAMEYVNGLDLREVCERGSEQGNFVPIELAARICADVATGLHHAHRQGDEFGRPLNIVHRDISPQNVLIGLDGSVKICDFGIARAESRLTSTGSGEFKGKFSYMSPEQFRGEALDGRSDLYSLGIILYETTVGRRLFRGANEYETIKLVGQAHIAPPSQVVPGFSKPLERIILKLLQRDPDKRYRSGDEVRDALEDWLFTHRRRATNADLERYMHSLNGPLGGRREFFENQVRAGDESLGERIASYAPARVLPAQGHASQTPLPAVDARAGTPMASHAATPLPRERPRAASGPVRAASVQVVATSLATASKTERGASRASRTRSSVPPPPQSSVATLPERDPQYDDFADNGEVTRLTALDVSQDARAAEPRPTPPRVATPANVASLTPATPSRSVPASSVEPAQAATARIPALPPPTPAPSSATHRAVMAEPAGVDDSLEAGATVVTTVLDASAEEPGHAWQPSAVAPALDHPSSEALHAALPPLALAEDRRTWPVAVRQTGNDPAPETDVPMGPGPNRTALMAPKVSVSREAHEEDVEAEPTQASAAVAPLPTSPASPPSPASSALAPLEPSESAVASSLAPAPTRPVTPLPGPTRLPTGPLAAATSPSAGLPDGGPAPEPVEDVDSEGSGDAHLDVPLGDMPREVVPTPRAITGPAGALRPQTPVQLAARPRTGPQPVADGRDGERVTTGGEVSLPVAQELEATPADHAVGAPRDGRWEGAGDADFGELRRMTVVTRLKALGAALGVVALAGAFVWLAIVEARQTPVSAQVSPEVGAVAAAVVLEPRRYPVSLATEPAGARVVLNGAPVTGRTPLEVTLEEGKPFEVLVFREGFRPGRWSESTGPAAGADGRVLAPLVTLEADNPASSARLRVVSEPQGATVWIDGEPMGVTPVELDVAGGAVLHHVYVQAEGYRAHAAYVELEPGQKATVDSRLVAEGSADAPLVETRILMRPAWAQVFVDGVELPMPSAEGGAGARVGFMQRAHLVELIARSPSHEQVSHVVDTTRLGRLAWVGQLKSIERESGRVSVRVPKGVTLYIGARSYAKSPVREVELDAGEHAVVVETADRRRERGRLEVIAGRHTRYRIALGEQGMQISRDGE